MKKYKTKKILTIFISLALVLLLSASVFAEDLPNINTFNHIYKNYDEAKKVSLNDQNVSFDEIEDLIHLNNATVKSNWNSFENRKSNNDIVGDYLDAADSLEELASSATSDVQMAMYQAQAEAMRMNADNNVDDSNTNFLNYLIVEKNLVLSTKTLYIDYLKSLFDVINAEEDVEEAKRKLETAINNENLGNGTRLETLTARKAESDAEASLMTANSNKRTYLRNLLINIGFDVNKDYNINELPNINVNIANTIDINSDYQKALENNHQFETFKRRLQNASTDEYKNQYKIQIDSAPSYIRSDLEKKYADIQDAYSSYVNMQISLELYQDEHDKASKEYTTGNISKKQYLTTVTNLNKGKNEVKKAMYDIMKAYEIYVSSVNGLASASAG